MELAGHPELVSDDTDEEEFDVESALWRAACQCQAVLMSLTRFDQLLVEARKRFEGRTFTEEMIRQVEADFKEGEATLRIKFPEIAGADSSSDAQA